MPRSLLCLLTLALCAGCIEPSFPSDADLGVLRELGRLSAPTPDATNALATHPAAIDLGRRLFNDTAISGCGTVSCASCHIPEEGYTYASGPGAIGCDGSETPRNPPTLLNAAYSTWFMWDGRADRLWSQALLPYLNPGEMAGTPALLRQELSTRYASDYAALFGENPELSGDDELLANFGKALHAFEATLIQRDAPFDDQLATYLAAVEEGTQDTHPLHLGLKTFVRKGACSTCHKNATFTDEDFHNVGVADATAGRRGRLDGIPLVLESAFNAAGIYSDKASGLDAFAANRISHLELLWNDPVRREELEALGQLEGAFRTPTLRNVALTAPYMHTGALATLEEVVDFYDRGGDPDGSFVGTRAGTIQPLALTAEEKAALVELLTLLTGETSP